MNGDAPQRASNGQMRNRRIAHPRSKMGSASRIDQAVGNIFGGAPASPSLPSAPLQNNGANNAPNGFGQGNLFGQSNSGFNFSAGGSNTGNPFSFSGSTSNPNATNNNPFGGSNNNTSGTGTLFGNAGTTNTSFPSPSTNAGFQFKPMSSTGPSMFSTGSATPQSSSLNQGASAAPSSSTNGSLFSMGGAQNKPATLFGASNTFAPTSAPSSMSNTLGSTSQQASFGLFGSSAPSTAAPNTSGPSATTSLFDSGFANSQEQKDKGAFESTKAGDVEMDESPRKQPNLFGAPSEETPRKRSNPFGDTSDETADTSHKRSNLFGSQSAKISGTSSSFPPSDTPRKRSNPFGDRDDDTRDPPSKRSNLFGNQPSNTPATSSSFSSSGTNLFNTESSASVSFPPNPKPVNSLSGSIFGSGKPASEETAPATNPFGKIATSTTGSAPNFNPKPSAQEPKQDQSAAAPSTPSLKLFGQLPANQTTSSFAKKAQEATPPSSLFSGFKPKPAEIPGPSSALKPASTPGALQPEKSDVGAVSAAPTAASTSIAPSSGSLFQGFTPKAPQTNGSPGEAVPAKPSAGAFGFGNATQGKAPAATPAPSSRPVSGLESWDADAMKDEAVRKSVASGQVLKVLFNEELQKAEARVLKQNKMAMLVPLHEWYAEQCQWVQAALKKLRQSTTNASQEARTAAVAAFDAEIRQRTSGFQNSRPDQATAAKVPDVKPNPSSQVPPAANGNAATSTPSNKSKALGTFQNMFESSASKQAFSDKPTASPAKPGALFGASQPASGGASIFASQSKPQAGASLFQNLKASVQEDQDEDDEDDGAAQAQKKPSTDAPVAAPKTLFGNAAAGSGKSLFERLTPAPTENKAQASPFSTRETTPSAVADESAAESSKSAEPASSGLNLDGNAPDEQTSLGTLNEQERADNEVLVDIAEARLTHFNSQTKTWDKKGQGRLFLIKNKASGACRVLSRNPAGKVLLNTQLLAQGTYKSPKKARVTLPAVSAQGGLQTWLVTVRDDATAQTLLGQLEAHKADAATGASAS